MPAAIETFSQLTARTLAWMSHQDNQGLMKTLVQDALRSSHARRLTQEAWAFMRWPGVMLLNIVAGQRRYSLHELFLFPIYMQNRTTSADVVEVPEGNFLDHYDGFGAVGPAEQFRYVGRSKFLRQPAAAGVVNVVSSDPLDNAKTVTISGLTATNSVIEETITLPGDSTTAFVELLEFRKNDAVWAGTLTASVASVTVLELSANEWGKSYQQIEFLSTPQAVEVIESQFYRQPKLLAHDNDTFDTPPPFTHIHLWDALLDLQGYTRSTAGEVKRWEKNREELELSMQQTFLDGHTQGAQARYRSIVSRW